MSAPVPAPAPAAPATPPRVRRGRSLRARWTAAILTVGAVPLALFGVVTLAIQRRGLTESEKRHEVAVIDHVVTLLEADLGAAQEATHRVGRVVTEGRIADLDLRIELAREAMARAEVLAQVAIYLPDGSLADAIDRVGTHGTETAPPPPPERLPAVIVPAGADGAWLDPEHVPAGTVVRYVEPVDRDGQRRAWVVGTLRAGALSRHLRELSMDYFDGRDDGILVLDRTGRVLASGTPRGVLSPGRSLVGRDILRAAGLTPAAFDTGVATSTEFTADGGHAMVGTVRPVPRRGWAVVARREAAAVYAALRRARQLLGLAGGSFALLALAVGTILAARTVRPVRALTDLARAYARRDFAVRSPVHTGDELEALGGTMSDMADSLARSEAEIARRAAVEADLSRFLPASVATAIARGERALVLGGERRAVAVLFADVVSFTSFAEGTEPERVVAFLNELFTVLTEVVFRHEGTVDKFVGDCVMAFFGAPDPQVDHAARALAAAEDMHRFVEASAPEWKQKYGLDVRLAIGVNAGVAVVGNLGSEARMEYTTIGDVVNVAARLEAMARPGQTLLTAEVATAAGDAFVYNSLGEHPLRGKRQAVQLLELAR